MNQPFVSVIVPVYNGAEFLREALDSVVAQDYAPLEIIIVDDGSTDTTAQVVQSFAEHSHVPVQYVYQENRGPAAARNRGIELARGELIAFQDADDVWANGKLAQQEMLLKQSPAVSVVLGYTQVISAKSGGLPVPLLGVQVAPGLISLLQAALFRRTVFDQVGRLDEQLRLSEDIDWFLRALEHHVQIVTHQDVVLLYRRHVANLTHHRQKTTDGLLLAIKLSLSRRRQATGQSHELPVRFQLMLPENQNNSHGK